MKKAIYTFLILIFGLSSSFAAISNFTNKDLTGTEPISVTDAYAKGIRLTWNLNTESDIDSYVVYYSINSLDNFTSHSTATHPSNIWISDVDFVRYDTYNWVLTAIDRSDNESEPSSIVQVNIINSNPKFTSSTLCL